MTLFTAGCQAAISWKFSSMTQSNSSSGRALFASLSAGSAWIRSPREVSLMSRTLFIFSRKEPFQERAEAVPLQVPRASFFGSDVVELDGAPLAFERLMSVPAVGRDLEDQASSGIRRHFRGVGAQIPVVVEKPEAPLGRAPAGVQVEKNGDQLGFGIGVDAAVLFPGAAANREHRRLVLQIHAQALAHQIPQLDAVHLLDERRKAARARNGFRRKAPPLADARKARHHFRESLLADDVADDEMRKGLGDQSGLSKRIRIQYRPHEPLPPPFRVPASRKRRILFPLAGLYLRHQLAAGPPNAGPAGETLGACLPKPLFRPRVLAAKHPSKADARERQGGSFLFRLRRSTGDVDAAPASAATFNMRDNPMVNEGKVMEEGKAKALQAALAQIEKQFGKGSIMKMDSQAAQDVQVVSTGSLGLDIALGVGGLPRGRVVEIYGPESSGKTTLTLSVIAQVQKLGGTAAFIDAENALDPQYAAKLGVKIEELLISQPDTGEQALEIADMLVRSGSVDVIVIDSVAALTPKAEIEGEMGEPQMGLQARLMSQALRKLTSNIKRTNTLVIFINQIRMKIGVMFGNPETTTGGNALKFYASVRLDIRRIGSIKRGDEVVGSETRVKVVKNKVAPPFREALFDILYGEGVSLEGEILELGVNCGVVDKSGAWYQYKKDRIGQGKDNAREFLKENPELAAEIEAADAARAQLARAGPEAACAARA